MSVDAHQKAMTLVEALLDEVRGGEDLLASTDLAQTATLALTLAGCTSSDEGETAATSTAPETPAEPEPQLIDWTDCDSQIDPIIAGRPGSERDLLFSCGTTTVPVAPAKSGSDEAGKSASTASTHQCFEPGVAQLR